MTPHSVLMVQSSVSKMRVEREGEKGGGVTFDVQQQKRGKITDYNSLPTLRLLLMMQKATGEKKDFLFLQFGERHFLPFNHVCHG